jgi:hypothetical protein
MLDGLLIVHPIAVFFCLSACCCCSVVVHNTHRECVQLPMLMLFCFSQNELICLYRPVCCCIVQFYVFAASVLLLGYWKAGVVWAEGMNKIIKKSKPYLCMMIDLLASQAWPKVNFKSADRLGFGYE